MMNIMNNIFTGQYRADLSYNFACILTNDGAGTTISNNYFQTCYDRAIDVEQISNGGIDNYNINNNYIQDACHSNGDCGAIYMFDGSFTSGTNDVITNNFIRDLNLGDNQRVSGGNVGFCIYFDSTTRGKSISNNVCTGHVGYANPNGGGGNACFFIHAGSNNTYTGNICDEQGNTSMQIINSQSGINNSFIEEVIVANQAGTAGLGYAGAPGACSPNNNAYWNYNTSYGISNNIGQCGSDSNPHTINPLIHCWGAIIAPTSTAFNSPVNFPAQPDGWDTPGFWGPPGFTIPHTGTAPSWPTTSGDGVTCSSTN
jgi:hypothetical protein